MVEVALDAGPAGLDQHFAEGQVRRRVIGARGAVRVVSQHVLLEVVVVGLLLLLGTAGAWSAGSEVGGVLP